MKKIIIATVFAIMTIMFVYAQDNSTDTVEAQNASPDAVTEATKSVNVKVKEIKISCNPKIASKIIKCLGII